jgi:hypothetical protein
LWVFVWFITVTVKSIRPGVVDLALWLEGLGLHICNIIVGLECF